ncbi:hypothetical protein [Ancylobacter sp. G4_0304]|uniref:hypothetical protein n=1 Tax=Ancylobacter sp. G4_0304 TaxID=3114289 RepID=UPI0039C6452A
MDRNRITGAARHMGSRLKSVASHAGSDAATRAESAYDDALEAGVRVLEQARGRALDLADDTMDTGQRLYGHGMRALTRQAGAHPLAVIVAAGVAGAALALLFAAPRRR